MLRIHDRAYVRKLMVRFCARASTINQCITKFCLFFFYFGITRDKFHGGGGDF